MNLNLEEKKVLFVGPVFYDYHTLIQKKIEDLGANVSFYPEKKDGFLFGILNTLNPFLIFWYQKWYYFFLWRSIKDKKFTHFLLIRGYKIPSFFIEKIKKKNPDIKCIMYQWDSNQNNPYFNLLKYFNKSYTFDYKDYKEQDGLGFLQLFYTEDIRKLNNSEVNFKYDFFCFSSFTINRYNDMLSFIAFCKVNNYELKSFCFIPYTTYFKFKYLKRIDLDKQYLSFKPMPREDYLECLANSGIVVDFSHATQTGLSMRIIETYGAGKKIFTTNTSILNNPIYSSDWVQLVNVNSIKKPIYTNENDSDYKENLYIDNWLRILFSE